MNGARGLSGVERLWLAADRICSPFANQMVIEGDGDLPVDELRLAWGRLSRLRRLSLRLSAGGGRWVPAARTASFRVVEGPWDGRGPTAALEAPLPPRSGPVWQCVVWPDAGRLALRSHHAVADGGATARLAGELFAALRGEHLRDGPGAPHRDFEVARRWTDQAESDSLVDALTPWPQPLPMTPAVRWIRRSHSGSARKLLARTARALAGCVEGPGPVRVDVPVDLRQPAGLPAALGNLTGLVRLRVDDLSADSWLEDFGARLTGALQQDHGGGFPLAALRVRTLPVAVTAAVGRVGARRMHATGRAAATATLSNLGRIDPAGLSGGGFRARRCFFVPPGNPGNPLFLTLTGGPEGLEVAASAPLELAAQGRLERVVERILKLL